MAHFIGFINGSRGEASRLGTKNSGIEARAQGWNIGGRVAVRHNATTGKDEVTLEVTTGSNGSGHSLCLGTFIINANGEITKGK